MTFGPNRRLICALLLALGTTYYQFALLLPRARQRRVANEMSRGYAQGGDFYPIWLTGRALFSHGQDPYTNETTRDIQTGLFGRPMDARHPADPPLDYRAFSYPLYTDLLAAPLLPLGFDTVRFVLTPLFPVITAASLILWVRALRLRFSNSTLAIAIILTLASYPVLEGLFALQPGLLVGAALSVSVAALVRERYLLAGIWLALGTVKPQLVLLVALWLLLWAASDWKHRKRFAIGFICTTALLFLMCQLVLPGWFFGWWHSLAGYSRYTLPPLTQLVLGRILGTAVGLSMLVLAGVIGYKTRRHPADSPGFALAVSFILAVTVILLPTGGAVYDQVILLPAIFWLAARSDVIPKSSLPIRVLAICALIALSWQWFVACGVTIAALLHSSVISSAAVIVLPTRMAASLPFVVISLLSFFVVRFVRGQADAAGQAILD